MVTQVLGIDPGHTGAFATITLASRMVRVWDMPATKERGVSLHDVDDILNQVSVTGTAVALEWNTARPGEVPDFAFRFGLQTGQIDAKVHSRFGSCKHIAANLWTGKLGLPGKTWQGAMEQRAAMWEKHYPQWASLIYGPRGGILDGRLDALLIAHWMRLVEASPVGMKGGRRPPKCFGI